MSEQNPRGALLIDELPSVLKEHGKAFLHISINYNNKVIETFLDEELQLGEGRFDPFVLMEALDKCPSTIAFWSVLLSDLKEDLAVNKRKLDSIEATLRIALGDQIVEQRSSKTSKAASISEVNDSFARYINNEASSEEDLDAYLKGVENKKTILAKRKEYLQVQSEFHLVESQVDKIGIVVRAWSEQGYTLKSQVEIMKLLIQQGLMKIPTRAVYEGWEGE